MIHLDFGFCSSYISSTGWFLIDVQILVQVFDQHHEEVFRGLYVVLVPLILKGLSAKSTKMILLVDNEHVLVPCQLRIDGKVLP